jgi:hypothetical protein
VCHLSRLACGAHPVSEAGSRVIGFALIAAGALVCAAFFYLFQPVGVYDPEDDA